MIQEKQKKKPSKPSVERLPSSLACLPPSLSLTLPTRHSTNSVRLLQWHPLHPTAPPSTGPPSSPLQCNAPAGSHPPPTATTLLPLSLRLSVWRQRRGRRARRCRGGTGFRRTRTGANGPRGTTTRRRRRRPCSGGARIRVGSVQGTDVRRARSQSRGDLVPGWTTRTTRTTTRMNGGAR